MSTATYLKEYDTVLLCPYCYSEKSHGDRGCCGESSMHFEKHYAIFKGRKWDSVDPSTGEVLDEPCDESRVIDG